MKKYIGCDAHARYSIFASLREDGGWDPPVRVEHNELEMDRYLNAVAEGNSGGIGEFGELVLAGEGDGRGGA